MNHHMLKLNCLLKIDNNFKFFKKKNIIETFSYFFNNVSYIFNGGVGFNA